MASFDCLGNLESALDSYITRTCENRRAKTYCFFKISTKPALVRSFPCTAFLKSFMSSGDIKRVGGLEDLDVAVPSFQSPCVFELSVGVARLGYKILVRLTLLRGIRGGSMDACSDFEGEECRDLAAVFECQ